MGKLETEVIHIIMDKLGVSEDKITPQATFTEDFGADSLDQINLPTTVIPKQPTNWSKIKDLFL